MTSLLYVLALASGLLFPEPSPSLTPPCLTLAANSLDFDQLSACESLRGALFVIKREHHNCRAPRGPIEGRIHDHLRNSYGIRLCFLNQGPTEQLKGFDCLITKFPNNARDLTCLREASAPEVKSYKLNYESLFAHKVASYLDLAAKCPVGNGDATIAPASTLPQIVSLVARFEFAFALPIGREPVGTGMITHGFASLDPSLNSPFSAIEYVNMWLPR